MFKHVWTTWASINSPIWCFVFSLGASTCNQGLAVQISGPVSDIVLSNNMWMCIYVYIYIYLIYVVRSVRLVFAQAVHGELYAITETERLMEIAPLHFEVTRHWLVSQPTAPETLGKESTSRNQPERVRRQRSLNVNPMPGAQWTQGGHFWISTNKKVLVPTKIEEPWPRHQWLPVWNSCDSKTSMKSQQILPQNSKGEISFWKM